MDKEQWGAPNQLYFCGLFWLGVTWILEAPGHCPPYPPTCNAPGYNHILDLWPECSRCGWSVWCGGSSDRSHLLDLLSCFFFQQVLHNWCNKGRDMCYPVHVMHIIGRSSPCGGSGFRVLTISGSPYNRKQNVLSASFWFRVLTSHIGLAISYYISIIYILNVTFIWNYILSALCFPVWPNHHFNAVSTMFVYNWKIDIPIVFTVM